MTVLWTDRTAHDATGGKPQGAWQASRVEIDSRRIQPGDLFVALKGENFDGHDYAADALAKGATAVVVSKELPALKGKPLLMVADTQKALEALGIYNRKRSKAKIVGVTGSVGKTSTKEMLRMALAAHGATYATTGNFNNHIGTPLNLANLAPETPFAVFEMGMNHAGEISQLTKMVRPHVSAITNVEAVHMEFFPSLAAIAEAKSEIFEGMDGGTAVLNLDNAQFGVMQGKARAAKLKIETFGANKDADCHLVEYKPTASGCSIKASIFGKQVSYAIRAVGRHWATTSLLVIAATHALGLDDAKTIAALANFGELEGRGNLSPVLGGVVMIDDSYNASPAAMRAAFAKTAEVWEGSGRKGRKFAALGDMRELGPDGPSLHSGLADNIVKAGFDGVFTAGKLMKHLHDALPANIRAGHVDEAAQLLPLLTKGLKPGDILLVKGSHGTKMYEVAKALRDTHAEKKHAV